MHDQHEKQEMISLGGLWENESQGGNKYLSGSLGGAKILVFKNTYKEEGSKQPDWKIYLAPIKREGKKKKTEDDIPF